MTYHENVNLILDEILNFKIKEIPSDINFWMIRTQKGHFYQEFITKKYVALAWNNIDQNTDLSKNATEILGEDIKKIYKEINRPSTVINKCSKFINDIQVGDILIIPDRGTKSVAIAIAGEYFEETSKTVELEKQIIEKIEINPNTTEDLSCPYKKRRRITVLRTVQSSRLNYSLYRAISNQHGISKLNDYANYILNALYNCYAYKGSVVIVYNITKKTPIRPRELSSLLYSTTEYLCNIVPEESISTQVSLNSPGDIVYILDGMYNFIKNSLPGLFWLLVILGGGKAKSSEFFGLIDIIKQILLIKRDLQEKDLELKSKKLDNYGKDLELESKKLDNYEKKLAILQKASDMGIDFEKLVEPLEDIKKSSTSLQAEPIILNTSDDLEKESNDIDKVQ